MRLKIVYAIIEFYLYICRIYDEIRKEIHRAANPKKRH